MSVITPWAQIITWVKAMTGQTVIRLSPNSPAPPPPFLTVDTLGHRERGTFTQSNAIETASGSDKWKIKGGMTQAFTLRVQAYSGGDVEGDNSYYSARDIMESLQLALNNQELREDILSPNLSCQGIVAGLTDVSGLMGDRYHGRAYIDLGMEVFVPFEYAQGQYGQDLGGIERVLAYPRLLGGRSAPINAVIDSDDAN